MALVTTASYSILLNGSPSKTFKPTRGNRQGDPLCPFLFILMMEGLGRAIRATKEEGQIQGTEVSLTKSKIFFFNTDMWIRRNLSRILGFQRDSLPSKYLGVPLTNKLLRKDIWEPVLNKLKDKINKWTNKSPNLPGRPILTKAILQTIPIYMLSTIPTPTGVITQIINIQRDFLLGKGEEKKKWTLLAWERI
eukprot:PITA_29155